MDAIGVGAAIALAILTLCTLRIFNGQLDEMKKQTEIAGRPWISIEKVSVPENQALIAGEKIIMTTVAVAVKNIGHSPATHVAVRVQLSASGTGSYEDIVRAVCEDTIADTNTPFGQTIFQDRTGNPIDYPIRLSSAEVASYWKQYGGAFSVIGCAAYRSPVSPEVYYTGFIYDVLMNKYPEVPGRIPGKEIFLQNSLGGFITK